MGAARGENGAINGDPSWVAQEDSTGCENLGTQSGARLSDAWCDGSARRGSFAASFCLHAFAFEVSLAALPLFSFVILLAHIRLYFLGPNRLFDAL